MLFSPCQRNLAYGPQPLQNLDIYMPSGSSTDKRPVLIFIHGGAWRYGDKAYEAAVLTPYLEQGMVGVMINYRLVPQSTFPDQSNDCLLALQWVYNNIEQFGGDRDNLHLVGHSAGAYLAVLAAVQSRRLQELGIPCGSIRSCTGLSGIYDLAWQYEDWLLKIVHDFAGDQKSEQEASPLSLISSAALHPCGSFLIVSGSNDIDGSAIQSRIFCEMLKVKGVQARFLLMAGTDHTGVLQSMGEKGSIVFNEMINFINSNAPRLHDGT